MTTAEPKYTELTIHSFLNNLISKPFIKIYTKTNLEVNGHMKTYLTVWFSSEGAEPSVVAQKLQSMGFKPMKGHYDHVYDWNREATLDDVLQLCNNVHQTLKGLKVLYKIETI